MKKLYYGCIRHRYFFENSGKSLKRKKMHDHVVESLGEFHTAMSYLGVIGRRFGSAGLSDILVEAHL